MENASETEDKLKKAKDNYILLVSETSSIICFLFFITDNQNTN